MEQHYDQTNGKVWNYYRERKQRKEDLIKELENLQKRPDSHPSGFNADQFLNAFFKMESKFLRHKRAKWKRNDFRTLKILGQGAFGSVSLVRNKNYEKVPNYSPNDSNGTMSKMAKQNKNLFAMKTLNKHNVRQKNQVGHVIAERDILSEANNDWIVKLQGSFQVRMFFLNNSRLLHNYTLPLCDIDVYKNIFCLNFRTRKIYTSLWSMFLVVI